MSKASVTYRTVGSAALKPEYHHDQVEPPPIINFETFIPTNNPQRIYRAPLELTFSEKIAGKLAADPLLGSMDKAFTKAHSGKKTDRFGFARYAAGVSAALLLLIFMGL